MFDLNGKNALVTGASGGIGKEIARILHAAGATVTLSGTRVSVLEDVAAELGGTRLHVHPCNLAESESVEGLIPAAVEAMGGLDILVNNAGITRDQLILRMKDEDFADVLKVNLEAVWRLSRAASKVMMRARSGRIVNITSIVGATGNPGQTNYAASKAGMIGMSKSLAQEVASRGITVNCVAPGFIRSPMTDDLTDAQKEKLLSSIPAGKLGEGADIGYAVLYLASDEAGYMTGQTLHVNGGMAMF